MYICKEDSNINESGILLGPLPFPVPSSNPQVLELTLGWRRGAYAWGCGEASILLFVLWVEWCGGILLGADLSVWFLWFGGSITSCWWHVSHSASCFIGSQWEEAVTGITALCPRGPQWLALLPSHSSHTGALVVQACSCPQAFALLLSACFFVFETFFLLWKIL